MDLESSLKLIHLSDHPIDCIYPHALFAALCGYSGSEVLARYEERLWWPMNSIIYEQKLILRDEKKVKINYHGHTDISLYLVPIVPEGMKMNEISRNTKEYLEEK